jgi:hypothetical protein|tara:strand:+ start:781 stop:1242 length:462 start_codon:yes stop_codon:yes gene_type:complete
MMKNAMMTLVLTTIFLTQAICQETIYREWIFSNENLSSVALYKLDISHDADVDWDEFFSTKQPMTLVEVKMMNGETFFDFEELGVYSFISRTRTGIEFKHTHIVLDQDYIDFQEEQGWLIDEGGVTSSKNAPLRIARDRSVFVSSETMQQEAL